MSNKTILLIAKILGIIFVVWGGLLLSYLIFVVSSLSAVNTGIAILKESGELSMDVAKNIGVVVIIMLPICLSYFVAAFGLLKLKSWAYLALALVGLFGLVSSAPNFLKLASSLPNSLTFALSVGYLWFSYIMFKNKQLFK